MTAAWPFKTPEFGNSWMQHAAEVTAPAAISWLPATPLTYALALVGLGLIGGYLHRRWRSWQGNRYRREALRQLQHLQRRYETGDTESLGQLPELLRHCALACWPRHEVASLHDRQWQQFLLDTCPAMSDVEPRCLDELLRLAYIPPEQRKATSAEQANRYFHWCRQWIERHQRDAAQNHPPTPSGEQP